MAEMLIGTIERIVFNNDENGYTVARFSVPRRYDLLTVVGNLADVHPGARLRLWGDRKTHPVYGEQFVIERYQEERPATVEGIRKYLGSGLIKGLGPVMATRIAEHFGTYTLEVIENDISRLSEVNGIGPKRVAQISRAWETQKQIKTVMLFLQSHNVNTRLAVKIYKTYGDAAIETVQNDPYRLAQDIYGIGFVTADTIARNLGIAEDAPSRLQAGLEYTLNTLADEGHVYAPEAHLLQTAATLLKVDASLLKEQLPVLVTAERVVRTSLPGAADDADSLVYLAPFYWAEVGVTRRLKRLQQEGQAASRLRDFQELNWAQALAYLQTQAGVHLAEQQITAVKTALLEPVSILTGGPGTGKTTTVRSVLHLLQAKHKRVLLAAPTGRAAKRLSETTGQAAKTLHRLLEVDPSAGFRFKRDQDNPLEADIVIVDEVSMIDLILMNNLLKALAAGTHLLLVGDADQLPSVGAGNVLRDIIASGVLPTVRLEVVFRQAQDSTIIRNAHRINQGQTPLFPADGQDFYFFGKSDPEAAAPLVVDIVKRRIPQKFGYHPINDIQVLSPMHRGSVGVGQLNIQLQNELNPERAGSEQYQSGSRRFQVGDKVLQLRNNYDKDVFNGDIGFVARIDPELGELFIRFDEREVSYEPGDLDELTLAYAMSVHKSQGSEYPVVVMPVLTQHYLMLQRNLLYTAITRAKKMVVLVGTRKAIAIAVRNNRVDERWTALAERLQKESGS